MIILKGILALAILFIIPLLIGLLITNFLKDEKNNIILSFVLGYLTEFAVCQLLVVPMIFIQSSFTSFMYIYLGITSLLSIVSIYINRKNIKDVIKENFNKIKMFPKFLSITAIILILVQIYAFIGYAHIDNDDAFYVGTATTTVQTDSLYKYSPTTGESINGDHLSLRYRLAPFPIFVAVLSEVIDIHPAILAHLIIPIIFVPIVYMIYGLIGNELFKSDKNKVVLFLIIMSFLHIWGNYSIRNNYTFLLFRIWQGKSVLANIIIPSIILFFIKAEKNEYGFINILILLITILAGTFTTTMGIGLPPIMLMLLCIIYEMSKINYKQLKKNNYKLFLKNMAKCLSCCIPCIIYAVIYFINL